MAKGYRVARKNDISHFRATSRRTKKISRRMGNTQGGTRL